MNRRLARHHHLGAPIAIALVVVWLSAVVVGQPGPGNGRSDDSYISADGRVVTYRSSSSNLDANDMTGTRDATVRGPSLASSAPAVTWSSPSIAASVRRGTAYTEAMSLNVTADVTDVSVDISSSLEGLIESFDIPDPYNLTTGSEYFPITFDIPKSAPLGPRTGAVEVRSSTSQLLAELTVNLEVTEPIAGVVPPSLSQPASSRIGIDDEGLPVVLDEILVGIDDAAPDPEVRILAIAAAHDAIVMGSIPADV